MFTVVNKHKISNFSYVTHIEKLQNGGKLICCSPDYHCQVLLVDSHNVSTEISRFACSSNSSSNSSSSFNSKPIIKDLICAAGDGGNGGNENVFFLADSAGFVSGWDIRIDNGNPVWVGRAADELFTIAINCEGNLIAGGSTGEAGIRLWDVRINGGEDKYLRDITEAHTQDVTQVCFHKRKGNVLCSASEDGLICGYDLNVADEDDVITTIINEGQTTTKMRFFNGNETTGNDENDMMIYVLTGTETLSVWNVQTSDRILHCENARELLTADYLIDCKFDEANSRLLLLAGSNEGNIVAASVNSNLITPLWMLNRGHSDVVRSICWGNNNISDNNNSNCVFWTGGEDQTICQWGISNSNNNNNNNNDSDSLALPNLFLKNNNNNNDNNNNNNDDDVGGSSSDMMSLTSTKGVNGGKMTKRNLK